MLVSPVDGMDNEEKQVNLTLHNYDICDPNDEDDPGASLDILAESGRLELTIARFDNARCWIFEGAELDILLAAVRAAIAERDD